MVESGTADEIRKLKALLDEGIITQEEFDKQKEILLNPQKPEEQITVYGPGASRQQAQYWANTVNYNKRPYGPGVGQKSYSSLITMILFLFLISCFIFYAISPKVETENNDIKNNKKNNTSSDIKKETESFEKSEPLKESKENTTAVNTTAEPATELNGYNVKIYESGEKYEGNFVNGVRSGQGKYTWLNGIIFEGEWINGMPGENGVYTYPLDIDYILLRNNYSDVEYKDKWVRIIGKVKKQNYMKRIYFESGISGDNDNYVEITANDESAIDNFKDGEYVVVTGIVDSQTVYFKTVNVKNAVIEKATNDDIALFNQYAKIRNQLEIQAANDYMNSAKSITYDNLIRLPDDYKGEIVKVTVRITQIFDDSGILGFLFEKGYAGKQGDNEWVIQYELPDGASRIIENDTVTFYGVFDGLQERSRAIGGSKVYIPHLTAKYHK